MQALDRASSVMVASSRLFAYFNHSLVAVSCVKVIVVIAFRGAVTDADDRWHSGQLAYYQVNWAHFQGAQCGRWLSAVPLRRQHREERLAHVTTNLGTNPAGARVLKNTQRRELLATARPPARGVSGTILIFTGPRI